MNLIEMDKEWLEKPISERREWYYYELDRLFDYLVKKEPLVDAETMANSRKVLKEIKRRMELDQKAGAESHITGEEVREYYYSVDKAYNELPRSDTDTDADVWFGKLGRAIEFLLDLK